MFRNLILILLIFLSGFLSAQNDDSSLLDEEILELSKAYQFDQDQTFELKRILLRRNEMLMGIQDQKENDFDRFILLRRSIYKGTEGSVKLILDEDQIPLYNEKAKRKRKINAERIKALKAQGAGKQQLIDAGLGIEW